MKTGVRQGTEQVRGVARRTITASASATRVRHNGDQRTDVRPQHGEVDGDSESVGARALVPTLAAVFVGSVALVGSPTTEVRWVLERHSQQQDAEDDHDLPPRTQVSCGYDEDGKYNPHAPWKQQWDAWCRRRLPRAQPPS